MLDVQCPRPQSVRFAVVLAAICLYDISGIRNGVTPFASAELANSSSCVPACSSGLTCGTSGLCVYRLNHSIRGEEIDFNEGVRFFISAEYLDVDAANRSSWRTVSTSYTNVSTPISYVDIPANHTGTFFRSRLDVADGALRFTLSLATAGTPPAGFPALSWGVLPFVQAGEDPVSSGSFNATVRLPSVPSALTATYSDFVFEVYAANMSLIGSGVVAAGRLVTSFPAGVYTLQVRPWAGAASNYTTYSQSISFIVGDPAAIRGASMSENGDVCSPSCTDGRSCIASNICQFRLQHPVNMSSFGAGTVAIFNSTAEYLVSLSNNTYRWLAAPVGNRASSSYPSLVLISAAHAGTYYRSRLDITSSGTVTTLSIVHAGQPPSGYPSLIWPEGNYVTLGATVNNANNFTAHVPVLRQSSLRALFSRRAVIGRAVNATFTSATFAGSDPGQWMFSHASSGQYVFRVTPVPLTGNTSYAQLPDIFFYVGTPGEEQVPGQPPSFIPCTSPCFNGSTCIEGSCQYYIDDAVNGTLLNRFANGSWLYNVSVQRYVTDSPGYFAAVPIVSRSQTTQPVSFAISPVGGSTFYRSKLEVTTGPSSGRRINTLAVFIHGEPPSRFVLFDWGNFPYLLSVERSGVTGQLFKVNISLPYVLQEYIAIYTSLLVEYRSSSGVRPPVNITVPATTTVLQLNLTESGQYVMSVRMVHFGGNRSLDHDAQLLFFYVEEPAPWNSTEPPPMNSTASAECRPNCTRGAMCVSGTCQPSAECRPNCTRGAVCVSGTCQLFSLTGTTVTPARRTVAASTTRDMDSTSNQATSMSAFRSNPPLIDGVSATTRNCGISSLLWLVSVCCLLLANNPSLWLASVQVEI